MADGRAELEWNQTSVLWAVLMNANRDPKRRSKPFMPDDINPYADRTRHTRGRAVTNIAELKPVFDPLGRRK